jgi:hypothetical protein
VLVELFLFLAELFQFLAELFQSWIICSHILRNHSSATRAVPVDALAHPKAGQAVLIELFSEQAMLFMKFLNYPVVLREVKLCFYSFDFTHVHPGCHPRMGPTSWVVTLMLLDCMGGGGWLGENRTQDRTPTVQQRASCSWSRRRPQKVDKRMVLEHTHGLFIT